MILRIFHPIGQGAFYSERHPGFNFVYDCGRLGSGGKKKGDDLVKASFTPGSEIDVLCISHFDMDHVNHIATLRDNFTIKRVVLPLLHKNQKQILIGFYRALKVNTDLIKLIENPDTFFKDNTVIIYIKPFLDAGDDDIAAVDISTILNSTQLKSGVRLNLVEHFWQYRPFNIEYIERNRQLVDIMEQNGVDPDEFMDHVQYLSGPDRGELIKKVKAAYKRVKGDINQNSMFVYSGPIDGKVQNSTLELKTDAVDEQPNDLTSYQRLCTDNTNPACIYTGDGDLNKFDIKKHYHSEWDLIGTIQMPHHGSLKSFNSDVLDRSIAFPVSYGRKNNYGHPSEPVINEAIRKRCVVHLVTEEPSSIYTEIIIPSIWLEMDLQYQDTLIYLLQNYDTFLCWFLEAISREPEMIKFLKANKGLTSELTERVFLGELNVLKRLSCPQLFFDALGKINKLLPKGELKRKEIF